MKSSNPTFIACIAFVFVTLGGSRGIAQPSADDSNRDTARRLGTEGIEAFRVNDFTQADQKLEQAFRIYPTPTLGLWSGRARVQLGQWFQAAERFREAARIPENVGESTAQKQAQRDAEAELQALMLRIPALAIRVEGAEPGEVIVTIDGAALQKESFGEALPLNPGVHHLTATRGDRVQAADVLLVERDRKTHVFTFQAVGGASPLATTPAEGPDWRVHEEASAPNPSEQTEASVLTPIAMGAVVLGSVSLATSGVTALIANGKLDDCPNHKCASRDAKDSYDSLKTISTVTFYAGGVLALGGVVTWLLATNGRDGAREHVQLRVGPGSVQLHGAF